MPSLSGRTIMVLGGWGLVGRAICYELLKENPKEIVLCSLRESESQEAVSDLTGEIQFLNDTGKIEINTALVPEWGDIFLCTEYKDKNIREITDPEHLDKIISDTFDDLLKVDLSRNFLYDLIYRYKPDILIDAVNTATGVAYRDVHASVLDLRLRMRKIEAMKLSDKGYAEEIAGLMQSMRLHITAIELPRLIRHVQVIYNAMKSAGTQSYFKIGTTGTGGMGLNIPYTHSEEKPSQKLLSKSAVAGAHSLLLFLMNSTPGFAFTKEVKPAAAIAWKSIEYGTVARAGAPIMLFDNNPKTPFNISRSLDLAVDKDGRIRNLKTPLKAVYINTGENGLFSRGEFESITTTGQMEYVTPEEIAQAVKEELHGANTGYDIIGTLSNTVMKSTYRAGVMREHALELLRHLESENDDASIAFEILGPPRLSKLLYEAHLLKMIYKGIDGVIRSTPAAMSRKLTLAVKDDEKLRSRIISIGIPILLPDGKSMLRGPKVIVPPFRGANSVPVSPADLEKYSAEGWVDLRVSNMQLWQTRMALLKAEIESMDTEGRFVSKANTSSRLHRKHYEIDEGGQMVLNIGEVVGWIFNEEEEGSRKTYSHPRVKMPKTL
jgi:hypothetical protein